jgi:hypothetical protein
MRILLLSPYDTRSHRRWREGLVATFPEHDWTVLTLPPRHFSWRVRGNSLSWALAERERLQRSWDLVVATSMTDLSALKGMVPALAGVPALLYFHENQFAYPDRRVQQRLEPAVVSLYAALASARVVFNSDYNRQTFLEGVTSRIRRMRNAKPVTLRCTCPGWPSDTAGVNCRRHRCSPTWPGRPWRVAMPMP